MCTVYNIWRGMKLKPALPARTDLHTQLYIYTLHAWTIKSHEVAFSKPIEQSACGQSVSRGARCDSAWSTRIIRSALRRWRRPRPDNVTESTKWKRKLMGVALVPEVIRIEASVIDSGSSRRRWREYRCDSWIMRGDGEWPNARPTFICIPFVQAMRPVNIRYIHLCYRYSCGCKSNIAWLEN